MSIQLNSMHPDTIVGDDAHIVPLLALPLGELAARTG